MPFAGQLISEHNKSMGRYIRSISRQYLNTVIIMMLLIGATCATVLVALDRHSLQQNISFLTSNQFIRFQQLANQTRALMRASADLKLPEYIVDAMRDDILQAITDLRSVASRLETMHAEIKGNYLERLLPQDEAFERAREDLGKSVVEFLGRAEQIATAGTQERRDRYSFWGAIDFAAASDSMLMRGFSDLSQRTHERSTLSVYNAKLAGVCLLGDCQEFCAGGRFPQLKNRSPKMTANCVFASTHSRGARFHCSAALLRTRYNSFIAASSPGKWPRERTARRSLEFKASIAFVV